MGLFPIRRPMVGLHVGAQALTLVEVGREWWRAGRGWRLRRCIRRELPAGLLKLSATEPNIVNPTLFTEILRGMFDGMEGTCMALSLPDQCARLALFDFEALPHKSTEVEALLRFRFQKDLAVPLGDTRMAYRVFRRKTEHSQVVRVLVGAVRQDIIGQYERLCEQTGSIPMTIGLSSLLLFDACTAVMTTSVRDALFLHVSEHGLAFLAFQQGVPVFLRIKSLPVIPLRAPEEERAAGGAREGDIIESPVVQELLATMHYYADRYLGRPDEHGPRSCPLYLVKAYGAYQQTARESVDPQDPLGEATSRLISTSLGDRLQVNLMPLDWNVLRVSNGSPGGSLARSGLSAIAAMLVA